MTVSAQDISIHFHAAAERLAEAGIPHPLFEARLLLSHCLGIESHLLFLDPRPLSDARIAGFELLLRRRLRREPMAYILEGKEFWSLDFKVGPGVLVPRPETETLVMAVLAEYDKDFKGRVLDLGCGSGILSVVLARELPAVTVVALDRSETATGFTAANCRRHGVSDRVGVIRGDWCEAVGVPFDIVVANPPYVAENDRNALAPELFFEPETALFSGPDGFDDIKRIFAVLSRILTKRGAFFMEIGFGQEKMVLKMAGEYDWCAEAFVRNDLAGIPRVLVVKSQR